MSQHMTNFTGEDMEMKVVKETSQEDAREAKRKKAEDKKAAASPEAEQAATEAKNKKAAQEEQDQKSSGTDVPDGTTAEVLQWVGEDKARAQAALDKEQAEDNPRVGLTGELEKILS